MDPGAGRGPGHRAFAQKDAGQDWESLTDLKNETVEVLEVGGRLVSGRLADVTETFVLVDRKGTHDRVDRDRVHRITFVSASTRKRNTLIGLAIGVGGMGALAADYISREHDQFQAHGMAAALAVGAAGGSAIGYLTSSPESRNVAYERARSVRRFPSRNER